MFGFSLFYLGILELGIYRVSGVTSDVRRLKEKFDESKFFLSSFGFFCCQAKTRMKIGMVQYTKCNAVRIIRILSIAYISAVGICKFCH